MLVLLLLSALLLLLVSVLTLGTVVKSIVLVLIISDRVTEVLVDVVAATILSAAELSPNEKDAIHSPVIIGSSVKLQTSTSSSAAKSFLGGLGVFFSHKYISFT